MSDNEEKIQIVSFSTNESNQTTNDIIQILLDQYTHTLIRKSKHAISFTIVLPYSIITKKIMIVSVFNLSREYAGITDVNCYMFFIDLRTENSIDNLNVIITYSQNYCDRTKKIFVLGILNEDSESKQCIYKDDIKKIMDKGNFIYEYIELNLGKKKEVSDNLLNIFEKCSKEKNWDEGESDKNEKQAHSCNVF